MESGVVEPSRLVESSLTGQAIYPGFIIPGRGVVQFREYLDGNKGCKVTFTSGRTMIIPPGEVVTVRHPEYRGGF